MTKSGVYLRALSMALPCCTLFSPVATFAQDGGSGGLVMGLTFAEELRHEDDETVLRSELGFSLSTETRSQKLDLSLGAALEALSSDNSGEVIDPYASLDYALSNRSTALQFGLNFSSIDLDKSTSTEILETGDALILETEGQREVRATDLALTFGRDSSVGGSLRLRYSETDYQNASAALLDSISFRGTATLRYDISDATSLTFALSHSDLDRDGGTDTTTDRATLTLDSELGSGLTLNAHLGFTQVTSDTGLARSDQDGLTYGITLLAERPNGSLRGFLDSDISENGRRTTVRVDRELLLPRGSISAGIGASYREASGNTDPLYGLSFLHEFQNGQLDLNFTQSYSTTSTGQETLESRLTLGVVQSLTALSDLNFDMTLRDSQRLDAANSDSSQLDLTLSYSYDLTDNWTFRSGMTHTLRQADGLNDSTDDTIFVGVRLAREWRP